MDTPPSGRPAGIAKRDDVLDEADPLAGDDADWQQDDTAAATAPIEPSALLFWKGLLHGVLVATAVWCLLAALGFVLYRALA